MINVDGVILGNYRCSLAGVDLNRKWKKPDKYLVYFSNQTASINLFFKEVYKLKIILSSICNWYTCSF